jgi:hypothetical protein
MLVRPSIGRHDMNRRVLQVLAIAWAAGLLGTYVACRSTSREAEAPPSTTSPDPYAAHPGGPETFVGTKSAAVFEPSDVANDPPAATQQSGFHPLPSSKSGRAFTPPPQPGPAKRELFRGSKSGNVDLDPANLLFTDESPATSSTSQPATAPADPSPRSERILLPSSKSGRIWTQEVLKADGHAEWTTTQPAPAEPKP